MKQILLAVCMMLAMGAKAQSTWSYGSHQFTMKGNFTAQSYSQKATGVVTFTNVPQNYEEFEALYTQFLGKTPHGTAAMMPMAMGMRQPTMVTISAISLPPYSRAPPPRMAIRPSRPTPLR